MFYKKVKFGKEVEEDILAGCKIVADAVGSTHGPAGNCVLMDVEALYPKTTKDGVSVAKELFFLEDRWQRLGAQILINAAHKQLIETGDGTTCTIVLAYQLLKEGLQAISKGTNPARLRKGIDYAMDLIIKRMKEDRKLFFLYDGIKAIATISANNNPELGKLIADAITEVGEYGIVTYDKSIDSDHHVDYALGYQWTGGVDSQFFLTNAEKMKAELDDPFILVTDKVISWVSEILPLCNKVIEHCSKTGEHRPLLIIADEVTGEALQALAENNAKKKFNSCTVKADGLAVRKHHNLEDIAVLTGAKFITESRGHRLEDTKVEDLGGCKRFISGYGASAKSMIIEGKGNTADQEKKLTLLCKSEHEIDRKDAQERLARLTGGVAIIKVGGKTDSEQKEIMDRVDDAIRATRAAQEEGIVIGGGVAYLNAKNDLYYNDDDLKPMGKDEQIGMKILLTAIEAPFRNVLNNASVKPDRILKDIYKGKYQGYDALQREPVKDMFASGIIDPFKVVRTALQNAVSVASLLLISKTMITTHLEKQPQMEGSIDG